MGGTRAYGIRVPRVSREEKGLAAAASEVKRALGAGPARILHPALAAEGLEPRRTRPDLGEATRVDAPEFEPFDARGGVSGEHCPVRREDDDAPCPAVHAGLVPIAEVVGLHEDDLHGAREPGAVERRSLTRRVERRRFGKEGVEVLACVARVLRVGELEAIRAVSLRERNDRVDLAEVLTVEDDVEREGDAEVAQPAEDLALGRVRTGLPRDAIAAEDVGRLHAELHVIEPRPDELLEARAPDLGAVRHVVLV